MFWEQLTGDLFPQAVKEAKGVCLLPMSVIERHGHHMPLGTDMFIAREVCGRAAELEPVVVFPDFIFTQILEARHVPGTIAIDGDLFPRLLENVCSEIARNGLKKIVLYSAHGGNWNYSPFFAQTRLGQTRDYAVYVANPPLSPEDENDLAATWETEVDGHAGEQETSEILRIHPELVRTRSLPTNGEGMPKGRLKALTEAGLYTGIWWYADHPTHYRGDGRPATPEKGEKFLTAKARALAKALKLVKEDKATLKLQQEFFRAAEGHG
jgi:creatinine amidohydrolase